MSDTSQKKSPIELVAEREMKQRRIGGNTMQYTEIDWRKFKPLGDNILLRWEESHDELKVGKVSLVRPDTYKGQHYTGIVMKVGKKVDPGIHIGDRLIFDQFSGFQKFWDEELGRMALISESKQTAAFAIIPPRAKIGAGEPDFDYSA